MTKFLILFCLIFNNIFAHFEKIKDDVDVESAKSTGQKLYGNQLDRIGTSGSYINSREVTKRFRVEPGNYLVIPSTFGEDKDCDFMLRVFTEFLIETK